MKIRYLGPVISQKQYETEHRYIQAGIDEGAELIAGGLGHPSVSRKGITRHRPCSPT